jgi:hypothetical protein
VRPSGISLSIHLLKAGGLYYASVKGVSCRG